MNYSDRRARNGSERSLIELCIRKRIGIAEWWVLWNFGTKLGVNDLY